jgi:hypothetical protein
MLPGARTALPRLGRDWPLLYPWQDELQPLIDPPRIEGWGTFLVPSVNDHGDSPVAITRIPQVGVLG